MRTQKEYDKLVEENGLLKARLETAERLALQGGAGHQAIVDKAVSLKKFNDELVDACKTMMQTLGLFYKDKEITMPKHSHVQLSVEMKKAGKAIAEATE